MGQRVEAGNEVLSFSHMTCLFSAHSVLLHFIRIKKGESINLSVVFFSL